MAGAFSCPFSPLRNTGFGIFLVRSLLYPLSPQKGFQVSRTDKHGNGEIVGFMFSADLSARGQGSLVGFRVRRRFSANSVPGSAVRGPGHGRTPATVGRREGLCLIWSAAWCRSCRRRAPRVQELGPF